MNSFTRRTVLWSAGLMTATVAVVLAVGGWLLDRQMLRGIELLHAAEVEEIGGLLGPAPRLTDAEISTRILHDADSDSELLFIQVHDAAGGPARFRSRNLVAAVLPDGTPGAGHWPAELPGIGRIWVSESGRGAWRIRIASRLEPNERVLRDYGRVAGLLVLGVAVVSVGLGWGFSRLVLAPIRVIERTARRIGADNLGERIPVPAGGDELAALSRLLNQTFDRIENSFAQVKQFTAAASHELKTPLSVIRLNAERLRPRLETDGGGTAPLDDVLEGLEELNRIIDNLLFLSKADSGVLAMETQALRLPDWLRQWAEDAAALAEDARCRFELAAGGAGELRAVPSLLRQLLFNLLTNALKFGRPGGKVTLRTETTGGRWTLTMEDEGPGLPADQLERVFERFARYESAQDAHRRPGHGLGLAICRSIAELHGGSIRARNRSDGSGLQVVVELPAGATA